MILLPVDIRYAMDAEDPESQMGVPYKACLNGSRKVRIRAPSMDYPLLHDRDEINPLVGASTSLSMDDVRHKFAKEPSRLWLHYELTFPKGHSLGSSVIHDAAGDYEELQTRLVPVELKHKKMEFVNEGNYVAFFVARTDTGPRETGEVKKKAKKSNTSQLLADYRGRKTKAGTN